MGARWLARAVLALTAACLLALPLEAALRADDEAKTSLAGRLLVASPGATDPRFAETVILMVHHNAEGALGLIINRPLGERPVATLLKALGEKDEDVDGSLRVFEGGPVQPWLGFIVHSADYHRVDTATIDGRVAVTRNPAILRDIGHHKGPAKCFVVLGYAGWGPGQLEFEFRRHDWFVVPADPALIFDFDREKLWDEAMARRPQEL